MLGRLIVNPVCKHIVYCIVGFYEIAIIHFNCRIFDFQRD